MKRMDFLRELRALNVIELKSRIDEISAKLLNMKIKLKEGMLKNPMSLRILRRNIAIVNTILRQVQDGEQGRTILKEKEIQGDRVQKKNNKG